jgi:hypothetical protein
MRWKTPPPEPLVRTIRRFAWFPTDMDDGYTVWLESYTSVEEQVEIRGVFYWIAKKKYQ